MNSSYVQALETKARWLNWLRKERVVDLSTNESDATSGAYMILDAYEKSLATPDTHFMNRKFCELVDHARMSVPDDLKFDISWTHYRSGWLWLEKPFLTPKFVLNEQFRETAKIMHPQHEIKEIDVEITAIGWLPAFNVQTLSDGRRVSREGQGASGTMFLLFHPLRNGRGFGMWSYFTLMDGDLVLERIKAFEHAAEKEGGNYDDNRETDMLHEIRWIYTAFHLMAQKLAVEVKIHPDRAQRKRAAREGRQPESITVVSLRKLEAAREQAQLAGEHEPVEWHWQWEVRGHWRNQWYAAAQEHRQVFIEAYIKGPENKPLKDPGKKLFAAVR
jgi:hypothetical protein